ncbi:MAG: hypothetical protein LH471_07060 [Salinibacterium sp.]|nr:hypothetical protein [Salinibacterium sp.]
MVRYIWDGAQLLGEIRDRGDRNASPEMMEDDAPTWTTVTRSRCLDPSLCEFPPETSTVHSPHLGRVQYTHGIEGPDRPLRVLRIDYGDQSSWNEQVVIYPHENWRGQVDEVSSVDGRAGLADAAAQPSVDLPARNALAFYNLAPGRAGPRSWTGSLLAQQREASGLMYMRN